METKAKKGEYHNIFNKKCLPLTEDTKKLNMKFANKMFLPLKGIFSYINEARCGYALKTLFRSEYIFDICEVWCS